ncbi:uncharacterized protein FOMMEDRAFT_113079 [Fomitiporia mediterranea MF3/22]|uniref:uncharacterized protein n=1 Tax=Fomitiporia mediterranea (strain MF3/22) TaxID=694068 RepID=UPI00044089F5|nr:uncharacterized protein FOMMEDRAFT_113079 [Fomitiporia mediterranea MF3/22]EJC99129.1 hypothetical protein FOMMEDRAFT_113079 [Fomitiporia mediterranea MF3/22]
MRVTKDTTLKEDEQNWVLVPAKNGLPEYYEYTQPVEKGSLNDREYRIIRLKNRLEATIVRDKDADMSGACMDVSTGYFHDPDKMPGIAHWCEHLMFRGTKEHKSENGYDKYLSLHSGESNAHTTGSYAEFHFEVDSDALKDAVVLFSEFFHCPLFHEDSALREVEAVDSEHTGALQDDGWRLKYVNNSLARPGHPLRKFGNGSKATLIGKYLVSETPHSQHMSDKDRHDHRSSSRASRTESHGHGRASSTSSTRNSSASTRTHSETRHRDGSTGSAKRPSRTSSRSNRKGIEKEEAKNAREKAELEAAKKARLELIKWWEKEYCASRMSLALVGRESLDDLTRMVVEYFSPIKNTGQDPAPFKSLAQPYGKEELDKIVYVKTIKERYEITISFPLPWQGPLWRESPTDFIGYLLSHEGRGSLHAYLKKKGWIEGLIAGPMDPDRGISVFVIKLGLTKTGFENHEKVILTCFKFISLLRKSEFPEWMHKELRNIQELSFRFKEKGFALPHAMGIATGPMNLPIPRALLLNGPVLLWEWNEGLVRDILKGLDIENCYIIVAAKDHNNISGATWHKEKWYKAEYAMKRFESRFISEARKENDIPELALPERNPFIPENFDVDKVHVTEPRKRPALIERTPLMEVWHKKDDQFWVPKASVRIAVRTPAATTSPRTSALTKLFVRLVKDELTEYAYPARVAELGFSLVHNIRGFGITLGGYNDKLHILTAAVLKKIKHLDVREERLTVFINQEKRVLENMRLSQPISLSTHYLGYITDDHGFSTEEKLEALKDISVDELSHHVKVLLSQLRLVILVTGNLKREDAMSIAAKVKESFGARPVPEDELPKIRTRLLPKGCNYIWDPPVPNPDGDDSSVSYYCHIGSISNSRTRVTCLLLAKILDEPSFDVLRTQEQLGYNVFSSALPEVEMIGWLIGIQSEMDSRYLESRIEAFLRHMRKILKDMPDDELDKYKKSLEKGWTEKIKTVPQETGIFWGSIQGGYYDFRQNEKDARLLHEISMREVRTMFKECLDPSSKTRSKLSIHMRSQKPSKPPKVPVEPNVSIHAAQEFMGLLKKEGICVNENEYKSKCEVEFTLPEMQEYLEETCLSELQKNNDTKVQELFRRLKSLVEKHPVKPALEVKHIDNGAKFRQGLQLSDVAKPVKKYEVE